MKDSAKALLLIGGGAAVAYLAWQALKSGVSTAASAVTKTFATVSDALASGLYDLIGPSDTLYMQYARISFPDGSVHAIPTAIMSSDGTFTVPTPEQDPQHTEFTAAVEAAYGGTTYQAVKAQDGSFQAFPAALQANTALQASLIDPLAAQALVSIF